MAKEPSSPRGSSPDPPEVQTSAPVGATYPAEFLVRVAITPGKPGAPTESVEISNLGETATLGARRVAGDSVLSSVSATIDPEASRAVWDTVEKGSLRSFQPLSTEERVWDFGERALHLEWLPPGNTERLRHTARWQGPLDNESALAPLLEKLGELARDAGATLYYFPRGG